MEDKNIEKNKSRLKIYYSLLITIICIIGVSFAWFRLYLSQTENNTLASRTCFNTTLTEETSKIALTDEFPIVDEKGLKKTPFTFTVKNNCSSYVKMYITIDSTYRTSTSSSYLKDNYIKVNLSPKGTTDNNSVILGKQSLTDLDNNSKGYILLSTGLKANEEKSYDLRIWMDSAVTAEQGLNKSWSGKIVVVTSAAELPAAPNGWYEAGNGTLLASLRENNELKTPLTTPGREVSAHTKDDVESRTESVSSTYQAYYFTYGTGYESNGTKFNLTGTAVTSDTYANSYSSLVGKYFVSSSAPSNGSSTAGKMKTTTNLLYVYYVVSATSSSYTYKEITSNKNATEALLASTEDDYGTSYYFRGAVRNNYVEFANKCWRIVRITGDGSIKLVLHNDNTNSSSSPCSSSNNSEYYAAFARYSDSTYDQTFNEKYDDNAYVGLMYGSNIIGCENHPEITSKYTCKQNNYTWKGSTSYPEAHANANKSTILTNLETWYTNNLASYEIKLADTIWCNDKSIRSSDLGYGTNSTYYGAYSRLVSNQTPTLICPSDNNGGKLSKFTVSDTTNGNGNLTYKIGLLTADEIVFSGSLTGYYNHSTYLQENTGGIWWWSLSPYYFDGDDDNAYVLAVGSGRLNVVGVFSNYSLRPAISLVSDITISGGSGTSEDPYVIN